MELPLVRGLWLSAARSHLPNLSCTNSINGSAVYSEQRDFQFYKDFHVRFKSRVSANIFIFFGGYVSFSVVYSN